MTNKQIVIRKEGFNKNVKYNMSPERFEDENELTKEIVNKNSNKGLFGKIFARSKIKVINLTIKGNNNTTYFKF